MSVPRLLRQLAEDIREYSAMLVVLDLHRRIDAEDDGERLDAAIGGSGPHFQALARRQPFGHAPNVVDLLAGQPQDGGRLARLELEGQDAHPDQIAAVDT